MFDSKISRWAGIALPIFHFRIGLAFLYLPKAMYSSCPRGKDRKAVRAARSAKRLLEFDRKFVAAAAILAQRKVESERTEAADELLEEKKESCAVSIGKWAKAIIRWRRSKVNFWLWRFFSVSALDTCTAGVPPNLMAILQVNGHTTR